jgi:raffinose/stachyose/melibiose transport system permease protein
MKNSTIVTAFSLFFILFLSSMVSFAISKMRFTFKNHLYKYFMLGLTIPTFITIIPLYLIYAKLHLIDTYPGLILPQIAFALPFSVLLFVNFYKFISDEIIEAAYIDGCSIYRVYFGIIFPLSKNTILTVLSMGFINVWNDYLFSLIFINSTGMKTAPVGLQDFIGQHGATDWGATFASICITTLPTLIIYFTLNKRVSTGMTLGAVKE